jgi:23S rRNA pseudouridine1911/1915/1917 synthase
MNAQDPGGTAILYEDNHVICAVKPRGVLSQADGTGAPDMLTIIKEYVKAKYNKPGDVYLGLVHRLDRPVGGVMAFARTSKAAGRLSNQFRERSGKKIYFAVLLGAPEHASGRLENNIKKDGSINLVRVTEIDQNNTGKGTTAGKEYASLEYRVLAQANPGGRAFEYVDHNKHANGRANPDYQHAQSNPDNRAYAQANPDGETVGMSLVRVVLTTGRPHQIRAQFSHIGCPVAGDRKYGRQTPRVRRLPLASPQQPALWAASLAFAHPVSQKVITVSAPPPDEYPWNIFNNNLYKENFN